MADNNSASDVIDVGDPPSTDVALAGEPTVASLTPALRSSGALVTPAAPLDSIVEAFEEYQALASKLLVGDDYQKIGDKQFKKKSAWRKFSAAFGVSTEHVRHHHDVDALGRIVRSEFEIRAIAPNGRHEEGYGACSIWDRCQDHYGNCKPDCKKHCGGREGGCDGFNHFSKPEHDIPSTAETRAKNRALADLFGFGEVSAEEVDRDDPTMRKASWEQIDTLRAAAKELRGLGFEGEIGTKHAILGTTITFLDESDNQEYVEITAAGADELEARIKSIAGSLVSAAKDAAGADAPTPAPAAAPAGEPEGDHPPTATPASPVEEVPDAPSPAENGTDQRTGPVADSAKAPASTPTPGGDDGASQPVEPSGPAGAERAASHTPAPAPAPSEPAPRELSSPGERARVAQVLNATYGNEDGAKARGALCFIVSSGRTRSARELFADEAKMAIKAAKLLQAGNIGWAVYDDDGTVPLGPTDVPDEDAAATLMTTIPAGEDAGPGDAFIGALAEFLGVEKGTAE